MKQSPVFTSLQSPASLFTSSGRPVSGDCHSAYLAGRGGPQFFQELGCDAFNCLFPLRIEDFDDKGRVPKGNGSADSGEPVPEELCPSSLETGDNPFTLFGCPAIERKKQPEYFLHYRPG